MEGQGELPGLRSRGQSQGAALLNHRPGRGETGGTEVQINRRKDHRDGVQTCEAVNILGGRHIQMVDGERTQLDAKAHPPEAGEFVGMDFGGEAELEACFQNPPALILIEGFLLAKDIVEKRDPFSWKNRVFIPLDGLGKHFIYNQVQVTFRVFGIFRGNGVSSQKSGNEVHRLWSFAGLQLLSAYEFRMRFPGHSRF